jgi:hypothetical protein
MPRSSTGAASILALFAAGLAIAALAAEAPSFDSLDKDKDGKVSVAEASGHDALFVAFKNLDKDKDGLLTREEFAAFEKQKPGA